MKHLYKRVLFVSRAVVLPGSLSEGALFGCVEEQEETQHCLNVFFRKMYTWHSFPLFVWQDEHFMLIISAVGGNLNLKMGCFALGKAFFYLNT